MRLAMAALVAGTGCAQLFGLDNTTGVDASVDVATLQVQRVSVGASVIKAPQDMSAQTAQFIQSDGTKVDGTLVGTDSFASPVPGTPPVVFTVPDMTVPRRMMAMGARAQYYGLVAFEHPSPQAPLPSSQIALAVTLPAAKVAGETFSVQSIGAWMQSAVTVADTATSISQTLPYSGFTQMTGAPKARITSTDVTLVLRYNPTAQLSGVLQAQFDQTDGADGVSGTMTAVTADKMAMATIDPAAAGTRFAAVRPAVATLGQTWRVQAAPAWNYGIDTGVRLSSGTPLMTDTMITATYGNPFESLDWRALVVYSASQSRSYMYTEGANSLAVGLASTMVMTQEPSATAATFNFPAGLPITISADQTALVTDGQPLAVDPAKPLVVTAQLDRQGDTFFNLQLVELSIDTTGASPALKKTIVLDAYSATSTFNVPSELLTVGKSYYFTFRSVRGQFPDAAAGDLQNPMLPRAAAATDSAVFTVGMP